MFGTPIDPIPAHGGMHPEWPEGGLSVFGPLNRSRVIGWCRNVSPSTVDRVVSASESNSSILTQGVLEDDPDLESLPRRREAPRLGVGRLDWRNPEALGDRC